MSDTPRTDALDFGKPSEHFTNGPGYGELWELCRQLERELNELTKPVQTRWGPLTVWEINFRLEKELNEANRLLDLARRHPYIPNSLAQILNEPKQF